ncbi:MAG: DUF309 domain-containing protein [Chloroflexi bacterium]|nr:DUF309 domain-containing protein [Chloroflexota bacterium]
MMKDCNAPIHSLARLGIERFNAGQYWLAHEALEDAWNDEKGSVRDLYRGILQVAVVYFHISRKNSAGAIKMYERSQKWLNKWPTVCRGVDVEKLRDDLDIAIAEVEKLGEENIADFKGYTKIDYE